MPSRKPLVNGDIAVPVATKPAPGSKLPGYLRFPLFVILSLTLSSGLYTLVGELTNAESSTVSRTPDENVLSLVVAWRLAVLAVAWYGGYDPNDTGYLAILTNFPFHFFRTTFYQISPYTSLVSLLADYLSLYVPSYLLRPRDPVHNPKAPQAAVPNRNIITDFPAIFGCSLFASSIYGLALFTSYRTFLPGFLVTRFDGLRTLSLAHESQLAIVMIFALPTGYAAADFLLWHFIATQPNTGDITQKAFNPETASLWETFQYNTWGYSKRTRVLVSRTLTLAVLTGLNTWFRTWTSLEGAEGFGAAGWAAIWTGATIVVGAGFAWVGGDV